MKFTRTHTEWTCDICREKFYRERVWKFSVGQMPHPRRDVIVERDLCASCSDYLSDILGTPRRS